MKKFKSKKKKKYVFFKIILFFLMTFFLSKLTFNFLFNIKINNDKLISWSLNNSNHGMGRNIFFDNIVDILKELNPTKLLSFNIKNDSHISSDGDEISNLSNYVDDPNYIDVDNPKVYIYNTHQLEAYDINNIDYDITPNVQMASYLLKDKLNNYGIPTMVEMGSITDLLNSNGWNYSYSYKASRYYLESALKKYKNLELIIDLHRDSIPHDSSTIEYNGKKYAKILFVIGEDYDTYTSNLNVANKLDSILKKYVPSISRGVITKGGNGVNGIYNQDLNSNIVLIEVGGNENNLDEIINTINILSVTIKDYLGG